MDDATLGLVRQAPTVGLVGSRAASIPRAGLLQELFYEKPGDDGVVSDRSGGSRDGQLEGAHYVKFDGQDDHIEVTHSSWMDTANFTACCWVRPNNNTTLYQMIFTRSDGSASIPFELRMNNSTLQGVSRIGGGLKVASGGTVAANTWQHVAVRYNGSSFAVFLDGTKYSTTCSGSIHTDTSPMRIGGRGDGLYDLNGGVRTLMYFDHALTDAAIITLGSDDFSAVTPTAMWPVAEGDGTTVYDVTGNSRNGTLKNAVVATAWGSTQDDFHWNASRGFTLNSNVKRPARLDGTVDAVGNPIGSPAGPWLNASESTLNRNPSGDTDLISAGVLATDEVSKGDSLTNPSFSRKKSHGDDRFLVYDAALSGENLARVLAYVS